MAGRGVVVGAEVLAGFAAVPLPWEIGPQAARTVAEVTIETASRPRAELRRPGIAAVSRGPASAPDAIPVGGAVLIPARGAVPIPERVR